jgi:hypothetical protein
MKELLESCHPTCYDDAKEWYEGEMNRCETTTVEDPTDCQIDARNRYSVMINDCEIAEC